MEFFNLKNFCWNWAPKTYTWVETDKSFTSAQRVTGQNSTSEPNQCKLTTWKKSWARNKLHINGIKTQCFRTKKQFCCPHRKPKFRELKIRETTKICCRKCWNVFGHFWIRKENTGWANFNFCTTRFACRNIHSKNQKDYDRFFRLLLFAKKLAVLLHHISQNFLVFAIFSKNYELQETALRNRIWW